jgi:two-component system sensor histidine kinase/response regulator
LVEMMGGQIGVESTPGKGSTFWFTTMLEKQVKGVATVRERKSELADLRVLIVDDNATNRKIVHQQILSWGMRNGGATTAMEALEILRREAAAGDPYDLAILDMQMPEVDGLMLARMIKSDPALAATRLIMMTSLGQRNDEKIRAAGIAAYLTKPVKQSYLFDCLVTVLEREKGNRRNRKKAAEAPPTPPATVHAAPSVPDLPPPSRPLRILLAEDNAINQKVALKQLQKLGYSADAVANGLEALDALKRIPYDLILMDCQMPEMDGYEATQAIRLREGGSARIPIIAMTAHALEGDRERCLQAGMDDYLSKPVRTEELTALLEKWSRTSAKETETPPKGEERASENPSEEEGILDPEIVESIRDLQDDSEPDLFKELAELFMRDVPQRLEALERAIHEGDAATFRREAHTLKGSSGNLGASEMSLRASKLEQLSKQPDPERDLRELDRLKDEYGRVRRALEAEMEKGGPCR